MRPSPISSLVIAIAAIACGDTRAAPNAAEFARVASSISETADAHRTAIATVASVAACQAERDRYATQMGPLIDRLQAMSGSMDSCMAEMGHSNAASMVQTCASMRAEFDRHESDICASSDMNANAANTSLHANRMMTWASTASSEAGEMRRMMRGAGMMGAACRMH